MKLPENYENWIEFANKCNELLQEYPDMQTVKHLEEGIDERNVTEYSIDAVKAKAFDEVMEKVKFKKDNVMHMTVLKIDMPETIFNDIIDVLMLVAK